MTFSKFQGQTDFQSVANEIKARILADVLGPVDVASLKGKKVTVTGAYSSGGPAKSFIIQPVSLEVAP
jgi:predicted lipoprotein